MAMVVNHNIPALSTYNVVNATSNALSKSIKKLSTGLRINSAADDAAGLAISEKMRAQISGLSKAADNAQDGISMLQTAEGALTETHSILQRMRELSVQAANDTLTAQDRSYIQLEIDQLREEITNIGNTTQFNTKKLLNGDAAVLWSSSDNSTKAIINGGLRKIDQFGQKKSAEANYKIEIEADPGDAQVQKTDIMKIKHETTGGGSSSITAKIDNTLTGGGTTWANTITITDVTDVNVVTLGFPATSATFSVTIGGTTYTADAADIGTGTTPVTAAQLETELSTILSGVATVSLDAGTGTLTITSLNTSTEDTGITGASSIAALGFTGSHTSTVSPGTANNTITYKGLTDADVKAWADAGGTLTITQNSVSKTLNSTDLGAQTVAGLVSLINDTTHGFGTTVASVSGSDLVITSQAGTAASDASLAGTALTGAGTGGGGGGTSTIGTIADTTTQLRDIDKFWTSEGVFMLDDPQTITITQGDGQQASFTIYGTDTIQDLEDKLNNAIGTDLGQSAYLATATDKFATFVETAATPTDAETVEGTFVIRSAVAGNLGELNFSADENLLNALSLNEIQASSETRYTVTVKDAHDGTTIANAVDITGNKMIGIIDENVDVEFDSMLGGNITATDANGYFTLNDAGGYTTYLHLSDNTTVFQVGANEGEDMLVNIGDMRAQALGLNNVLVTDRDSAARSITVIDNAIDKVSTQRAKIGAYQNRLEYKISNLTTAYENMSSAESRIRDTDMAKEMMNFMKLQINLQAGTAMLSQANQLSQNVLSLLQ